MAYIVPKLNLNRLPKNCEDYSLTCAKNIKVVDDTIVNFDGLKQAVPRTLNIVLSTTGPNVTGEQHEEDESVVNQHRRIRRQNYDVAQGELIITAITEAVSCIASVDNFYILYKIIELNYTILDESGDEPVIRPSDITPDIKEDFEDTFLNSIIILDYNKYIELNTTTLGTVAYPTVYKHKRLNVIEGSVVLNSKGNTILELHQYGVDTTIPISFINLEEHNPTDIFLVNKDTGQPWWWYMDASYYTQTPIIPILNFVFKEYSDISINSGVYSLFIRYKVFGDTYSNWISCSTPFFIGNHRKTDTQVGSFYYSDSVLLASDYTITFDIVSAFNPSNQPIEAELAYLCKTEDEEYAAKLTTLKIEQLSQSFTFVPSHATDERISINDLLEPIFNITNVKNVTYKNNEFFASNYIEESLNKIFGNIQLPTIKYNKDILLSFDESLENNNQNDEESITILTSNIPVAESSTIASNNKYDVLVTNSTQQYETILETFSEYWYNIIKNRILNECPLIKRENLELYLDKIAYKNLFSDLYDWSQDNTFIDENGNPVTGRLAINEVNFIVCVESNIGVYYFDKVDESNVISLAPKTYKYNNDSYISDLLNNTILPKIISEIKIENNKIKIKKINNVDYEQEEYDNLWFGISFIEIWPTQTHKSPKQYSRHSINIHKRQVSINVNSKSESYPTYEDYKENIDNIATIILKQTYDFYVHFVRKDGFITNGYNIGSFAISDDDDLSNFSAYLPEFTDADYKSIPHDYVAYFYSFKKSENYTAEGVKAKTQLGNNSNKTIYDIPEMDLWLYSRYNKNKDAYKPSGIIEDYRYFGNSGKYEDLENNSDIIYLSSKKEYNDNILYRCTPYIPINITDVSKENLTTPTNNNNFVFSDYKHSLFLNGFVCKIYKARNYENDKLETVWLDSDFYIKEHESGSNALSRLNNAISDNSLNKDFYTLSQDFEVKIDNKFKLITEDNINLLLYGREIDLSDETNIHKEELESINLGNPRQSAPIFIHSNYNLNFLRLREELIATPRNIKIKLRTGLKVDYVEVNNDSQTTKIPKYEITYENIYKGIYIYKIASNTLDNIYKTVPFYKEFTILPYTKYDDKDTNEEYNTTIRKTAPIVASNKWELPKFKSTLLYNLDTNRGLITNLVAVGKAILIHTEKGLSAFEYNPKLTTNNGEINVENTEIFDINPVDVIGSENGYGGLKDKSNSAVCFEGYMFVDITSNEILLYDDSGLKPLTKDLKYLLSYFDIADAKLAGVQRNNICLLCLTLKNKIDNKEYVITISYNFELERFVSIHDFKFTKAVFNSINTIFEHKTEQIIHGVLLRNYDYSIIDFSDIFSVIPEFAQYNREDEDYLYPIKSEEEDDIVKHNSYIDVIVVGNYEQIKVLDFINWSLIVPNDFIGAIDDDSIDNTAETSYDNDLYNQDSSLLPYQTPFKRDNAKSITIISDSARTNEIDLTDATNDKELINTNTNKVNKDSYQKPRFNCGIWSLNYFRNEYAKDVNEKTLIYGKYFIIRFVFKTKRFKFETLNINTNKYV